MFFVVFLLTGSMALGRPVPTAQAGSRGGSGVYLSDFVEAYSSKSSAQIRARKLGCQGVHREGSLYVPCSTSAEYVASKEAHSAYTSFKSAAPRR